MELKNILITGSKGFIGKNLKKELLKNNNINLFEFNRGDSFDNLDEMVKVVDFIFHLAGEVRPNSSNEEFLSSHNTLTNQIIQSIEKYNRRIPILFSSTKHAVNPQNMYGKTKQETENIIKEYGQKNDVAIFIYRLPHVFGEGCKPNYNSVISTWIYNSIKNLEIKVFNRDILMKYVYVQDIVIDFVNKINENNKEKIFYEIEASFDTSLGEVVDYINEFKENINNSEYRILIDKEFKKKLFDVYISYTKNLEDNDALQ